MVRASRDFPPGSEPTSHLFRNNRDGTFTDVTLKAGVGHSGWGQGCCVGDYDNDGWDDLFVTYFGKNVLYHNNGDGTFTDVSQKVGIAGNGKRWNTGCAFVDYDRDGKLDLFVANYIDMDLATAPVPESGPCLYKSVMVACGPPGLQGGKNILYHNNGDGTFTDVSEASGILKREWDVRTRCSHGRLRQRRVARHLCCRRFHRQRALSQQEERKVRGYRDRSRMRAES